MPYLFGEHVQNNLKTWLLAYSTVQPVFWRVSLISSARMMVYKEYIYIYIYIYITGMDATLGDVQLLTHIPGFELSLYMAIRYLIA